MPNHPPMTDPQARIDELIAELEHESADGSACDDHYPLLLATVRIYLDRRDSLMCDLSSEFGEWCSHQNLPRYTSEVLTLRKIAMEYAMELTVDEGEARRLLYAVLDRVSRRYGYAQKVNWRLNVEER